MSEISSDQRSQRTAAGPGIFDLISAKPIATNTNATTLIPCGRGPSCIDDLTEAPPVGRREHRRFRGRKVLQQCVSDRACIIIYMGLRPIGRGMQDPCFLG